MRRPFKKYVTHYIFLCNKLYKEHPVKRQLPVKQGNSILALQLLSLQTKGARMKKHLFATPACLALIFIFTAVAYSGNTKTEAGRILTVKGSVYLIRDALRNNALPRMKLLAGDAVETARKSRTKLFFVDDSILNLGELSRVEVKEYLYSPERKRSRSIYRLIDGSLKMVVGKSDLEIHTPTAVAAARGTKFIVWVEGSGDRMFTGIITLESAVQVRNIAKGINGEVTVRQGQMSRVYINRPPEAVRPVDIEIMRQFSDQVSVLGNELNTAGMPEEPPSHAAGDLYMFQPPVTQEPITYTPVSVDVIYPD